jgi:hypothetical protein
MWCPLIFSRYFFLFLGAAVYALWRVDLLGKQHINKEKLCHFEAKLKVYI